MKTSVIFLEPQLQIVDLVLLHLQKNKQIESLSQIDIDKFEIEAIWSGEILRFLHFLEWRI